MVGAASAAGHTSIDLAVSGAHGCYLERLSCLDFGACMHPPYGTASAGQAQLLSQGLDNSACCLDVPSLSRSMLRQEVLVVICEGCKCRQVH